MVYTNVDLAIDYANYLVTERMLGRIAAGKMNLSLNELLVTYSIGTKAIKSIQDNAELADKRVLEVARFESTLEDLAAKIIVKAKSKRE